MGHKIQCKECGERNGWRSFDGYIHCDDCGATYTE